MHAVVDLFVQDLYFTCAFEYLVRNLCEMSPLTTLSGSFDYYWFISLAICAGWTGAIFLPSENILGSVEATIYSCPN
jgi:hypothetical protein